MLGKKCEVVRCVQEPYPYPEPDQSSPWLPSHILKIHLHIIFPSTPGSSQWSLYFTFPHKNSVHTSPLSIRSACPAHLIVYDLITRIIFVPDLYYNIIRTQNNVGIFGAVRFLQTLLSFLNTKHIITMLVFVTPYVWTTILIQCDMEIDGQAFYDNKYEEGLCPRCIFTYSLSLLNQIILF
jgi:hypothetical protein